MPVTLNTAGTASVIRKLVVLLVKPTKYDRRGYPLRFRWGVLPSNSLAVMHSLTKHAVSQGDLAQLASEVHSYDEIIWRQRVDNPARLVRRFADQKTKVVVGLVGVQTNQFPRAECLADAFLAAGASVVMGGFHVSGAISTMLDGVSNDDPGRPNVPCPQIMPPEVQRLIDKGVIICHGEAEEIWPQILEDIIKAKPQSLYRGGKPDILHAPMPEYPADYYRGFAARIGTIDTGRGCPFKCTFCTIINVQGRKSRWRDPQKIIELVKTQCQEHGRAMFFFVDDNLARNKMWQEILQGLIDLKRAGYNFNFMIEADLQSYRIPGFIEMLAEAGCSQAFLGMESVNKAVLKAHGKVQNQPEHYQELFDLLHTAGIAVHAGYIIGWETDTEESITRDVEQMKELGVDQASFFILTPLPGSEDHIKLYCAGVEMDSDLNRYDSFHAVMDHPNMSREQLRLMLRKAFRTFFTSKQMITVLRRLKRENFWGMFRNFVWYYNSVWGESHHPMMTGFWSVRRWGEVRPTETPETFGRYCWEETKFHCHYLGCLFRLFYIFQHVYFQTRLEPQLMQRASGRLRRGLAALPDWLWRTFGPTPSRNWLNRFWIRYGRQKWRLLNPLYWDWHVRMVPYATAEIVYSFRFGMVMLRHTKALLSR